MEWWVIYNVIYANFFSKTNCFFLLELDWQPAFTNVMQMESWLYYQIFASGGSQNHDSKGELEIGTATRGKLFLVWFIFFNYKQKQKEIPFKYLFLEK